MKLRSFFKALGAVVVGLLLVAAAGFYWIFAHSPLMLLRGEPATPAASMFVSKQAPVMVSLLVNPDRLESFRQVLAAPGERRQTRKELAQFKQGLLVSTGLDYARDIQPWLGEEMTLALTTLDLDRDRSNGSQPGYLLAMATKDPERSREFLELFWQKRAIAGADLTFEQYQGVKLIYAEHLWLQNNGQRPKAKGQKKKSSADLESSLKASSLASAVVGNQFVLFANHPKVLRDAITNVQAQELNLTQAKPYAKALGSLTEPRIGLAFVNLPGIARWLEEESVTPSKDLQAAQDTLKQVAASLPEGTYETMAIALGIERRGLMAETALLKADGKEPTITPALSRPVGALRYLPAMSAIAASGTDLDGLWEHLSDGLKGYDRLSLLINQPLQVLEKRWQFNVPEDIFSWVKGEYALGLVSNAGQPTEAEGKRKLRGQGKTSSIVDALSGKEWVFVADRSSAASSQAIAHLDDLAKQQGYSVGKLQLGNQEVAAWTRLSTTGQNTANMVQADVRGLHTTIDRYELFASSVKAMEAALQAANYALVDEQPFKQAIAPMHQPNNGYLYLDWLNSRPILEQEFPLLKVIELAGSPIFSHLQSLTLSSYGSQSGIQRSGVFIQLS